MSPDAPQQCSAANVVSTEVFDWEGIIKCRRLDYTPRISSVEGAVNDSGEWEVASGKWQVGIPSSQSPRGAAAPLVVHI